MQGAVLCMALYCAFWLALIAWARARVKEPELVTGPRMTCPGCKRMLPVDSVRRHVSGTRRLYWECAECKLSIMRRQ